MKKILFAALTLAVMMMPLSACGAKKQSKKATKKEVPTVYFIKEITPENLMKLYKALGVTPKGKVAVKVSTGEAGNPNYLSPALIGPLVKSLDGTIVECNTAYNGKRSSTEEHLKTAADHGFTAIAPVVIMDAEGQDTIKVNGGKHLGVNYVGKAWKDYDYTVVLSHFKGHPMGGFGGAMKNIAIGIASAEGKGWIHTAGKTSDLKQIWKNLPSQEVFQESMAEASKSIVDATKGNILFINIANNLSVDCDCVANPAPVKMADIGMFASLDPVAIDKACVDAIYKSEDHGKIHMIERIESRKGPHNLEYAEQIGVGSRNYKLVEIK